MGLILRYILIDTAVYVRRFRIPQVTLDTSGPLERGLRIPQVPFTIGLGYRRWRYLRYPRRVFRGTCGILSLFFGFSEST